MLELAHQDTIRTSSVAWNVQNWVLLLTLDQKIVPQPCRPAVMKLLSPICKQVRCMAHNTIEPSGHVRVLVVVMSSDSSPEKHVSAISATCFFHLRQIRRVRQSPDVGSAKTLVQAFVTSRVDYCNTVLAESQRVITDKLQRVMNSAARVVTDTRKYDSDLSRLMHDELHWLDVTDRVRFKLAVLMFRCLHGTALPYLINSCTLTAEVTGRQHLRSATQQKLVVPRYRLNSFGRQWFCVAGTSTWNLLPDSLRDPELSLDTFKRQLKTYIFAKYWWQNVFSALEIFLSMLYINLHFTYLLTYV